LHVAIIMDGSGRWAQARGLSRPEGHRAGAAAVGRVVEAAARLGVGTLTLFAFSGDNWQRPAREVANLMAIFEDYLATARRVAVAQGVRVSVIGRRDRLPLSLRAAVDAAEGATRDGRMLHLRLAIDYSGRGAILQAAQCTSRAGTPSPEEFARVIAGGESLPDVDLVIRTGGEQRLSDCPLWEIAYAELVFPERLWPDFDATDLQAAIHEFHSRDRRFGRILEPVGP
jgi:undecaprenyl diphosphate synthase